jgi:hypothetical protein
MRFKHKRRVKLHTEFCTERSIIPRYNVGQGNVFSLGWPLKANESQGERTRVLSPSPLISACIGSTPCLSYTAFDYSLYGVANVFFHVSFEPTFYLLPKPLERTIIPAFLTATI